MAGFRSCFSASVRLDCLGVDMTPEVVVGRLFEEVLRGAGVAGEEVEDTESRGGRERSWDDRRAQPATKGSCVITTLSLEDSAIGLRLCPTPYGADDAVVGGVPDADG